MSSRKPESVLRPGQENWELWKFPAKGLPSCAQNPDRKLLASAPQLLLALPTRSLLGVPLWIATEGNADELAELELSSRHLLRRDAAVSAAPIEQQDGRALILAIASSDDSPAAEYFPRAQFFEIPARLWESGGKDVVVWKELGDLCFGFYRDGRCVFFAATGESSPGPAFCGVVARAALRLRAEDVLLRLPASARLIGNFSEEERRALANGLRVDLEYLDTPPPPRLSHTPSAPAPPSARVAQTKRTNRRQLAFYGGIGFAFYALVLMLLGGDLGLRVMKLKRLRAEESAMAPTAKNAQRVLSEWQEFRSAVDPKYFALDELAAVAREIPGEQVRLTQITRENGRLIVAGEAANTEQAFEFSKRVKLSLQDYDWTERLPQLAGKSKVRFEMEGTRSDAKTSNE